MFLSASKSYLLIIERGVDPGLQVAQGSNIYRHSQTQETNHSFPARYTAESSFANRSFTAWTTAGLIVISLVYNRLPLSSHDGYIL